MRNLKKFLALVLALMMVVSVMVTVSAASSTQDKYLPAVEALENYGVLKGYTDGLPHPEREITRAEMAAFVYRIMTGDTDDSDIAKYSNYANKFTDVNKDAWYMGYIGFCANKGVLKGDPGKTVRPDEAITGYEVQAMLLRAVGYDRNNEYTGNDWTKNVLADATQTGISTGVTEDPAKATPRGAVAQLTLNAATEADRVLPAVWPSIGYNSLGEKLMEVTSKAGADDFGAPSTVYTITYTWPDVDVENTETVEAKPLYTFYGPVTECDFADATGVDGTFTTYTNGKGNVGEAVVQATDTNNTLGAQGREMIVYEDCIVYKDTVLAKVTDTTPELKDVNGHVTQKAQSELTVYGNNVMGGLDGASFAKTASSLSTTVTVDGTYTVGTVMTANILTKTPSNTLTTGVKLVSPVAATAKTVTVNAIIYDGDKTTATVIGFIGTDGTRYLYDVTFGYNATGRTVTAATLTNSDIGKTFGVYTDSRNNVLGIIPTPAAAPGYGVITGYKLVGLGTVTGTNEDYVIEYSILNPDGSTVTVTAAQPSGVPFNGITAAKASVGRDVLVFYQPNTNNPKYYDVGVASASATLTKLEAGHADARLSATNYLLNDNTVIFVANYTMSNSKSGYVFTGYSIYKGFKSIPDLANNGQTIYDATGAASTPTSLTITAFGSTKKNGGNYADYALVVNADEQSTDAVEPVASYAYVQYALQQSDVYDSYVEYNVLLNGTQSTLKVASDKEAADVIDANGAGLYIYDKSTNGAYGKVVGPVNKIEDKNWAYYAGVLSAKDKITLNGVKDDAKKYLTVAGGAVVYIVNPTNGKVTTATYDLGVLNDPKLYQRATLYFQLNQYGWIDVIYLVDNMANTPAGPESIDDVWVLWGAPAKGRELSSVWVKTTTENVTVKIDGWEKWVENDEFTGWKTYTGPNFGTNEGDKYRAKITVTADGGFELAESANIHGADGFPSSTVTSAGSSYSFYYTWTVA